MKHHIRYGITLFIILISACDNSDNNGDRPLFDAEIRSTEHYFFYTSANTLYAVDPKSPREPLLVAEDVVAPALIHHLTVPANEPETLVSLFPAIVYASGGRIWGVNAIKDEGLRKVQLSNEQNAFRICQISPSSNTYILEAGYEYTTPGENGVCDSQFSANDDVTKIVTLGMNSQSQPIPASIAYITIDPPYIVSFYEADPELGYITLGKLYQEGTDLVWYAGLHAPDNRTVVASGVGAIQLMSYALGNTALLRLDDELKQFSPYTLSLGQTLYTFQSGDQAQVVPDRNDLNYLTVIEPSGVYRLQVGGEPSTQLLYAPESPILAIDYINTTEGHIQFGIRSESGQVYYSISKDGNELIEWYREQSLYSERYRLSSTMYAFYDYSSVVFVSIDGLFRRTLAGSFIVSHTPFTRRNSSTPDGYIDLLLIGRFTGGGGVSLSTYDRSGNEVARLGEWTTASTERFWGNPVVSNDQMIIMLPGLHSDEVFFADLYSAGSLTQITENEIDEQIDWQLYVETSFGR